MMQKFRRVTFDDSIDIMDAELTLIDQQSIRRWFPFEKGQGAFDSENPADERADQERNNAEVGDQKRSVMFFPWSARRG